MHALKIPTIYISFMLDLSNTNISSKEKSIICAKKKIFLFSKDFLSNRLQLIL